jgi:hypothetical protein
VKEKVKESEKKNLLIMTRKKSFSSNTAQIMSHKLNVFFLLSIHKHVIRRKVSSSHEECLSNVI